jgi:hypothetical protein
MIARSRRKFEMGASALEFCREHPDESAGYTAAVARIEQCLEHGAVLAAKQRDGLLEVRTATARKRELRRTLTQAPLDHVAQVAKAASREVPELSRMFDARHDTGPYLNFRMAARSVEAKVIEHKELLVRYGLVESMLQSLSQGLDEFDRAVEQSSSGRQAHVGATGALDVVAADVVLAVRVMDGLNRMRFGHGSALLAAWESASNVVATRRSAPGAHSSADGALPSGSEARPAA